MPFDEPNIVIRRELLTALQQRRTPPKGKTAATRPAQPAGGYRHGIAQFDVLSAETGFDTLHVRDELLITGRSYDGRGTRTARPGQDGYAKPYLDALGLEAREVECRELRGRLLRLTSAGGMESRRLADVARNLRARGFSASLTHVAPTAMGIIKSPPLLVQAASSARAVPASVAQAAGASAPRPARGTPAKVAIIDTGITAEKRADGWLRTIPRKPRDIDPLSAFPFTGPDDYLDLNAGHGTFVAGLVQQVAPDADITVYRAVDSDGIASEVAVACEMIRAVRDGARIVNLSLGCQTHDDTPPLAIATALEVIRELERETGDQVLVVAAAGNYGDTRPCWPAAFRGVVSVAGLAPDMTPSPYSSRGFWVTCSTIGQDLRSTFVEGRLSPLVSPQATVFGPDSWAQWSGTSFAAPQVTGRVARLCQEEELEPRAALTRLLAKGCPRPDFGQALKIL